MGAANFAEVVRLVEQLEKSEKRALLRHLEASLTEEESELERLLARHARRVAEGEVEAGASLRNAFARPGLDLSFEAIQAERRALSRAWEDELDDLSDAD